MLTLIVVERDEERRKTVRREGVRCGEKEAPSLIERERVSGMQKQRDRV